VGWGAWLAAPFDAMDAPEFHKLVAVMPEAAWGLTMIALGHLHVVALIINGGRGWTPYARAAVTVGIGGVWIWIGGLSLQADFGTPTAPTYAGLGVMHLYSAVLALWDVGRGRASVAAR